LYYENTVFVSKIQFRQIFTKLDPLRSKKGRDGQMFTPLA